MNTRALIPLMPLLFGCTITLVNDGDGGADGNDSTSGDGDGDPTTGDGDGDGDGDPATGDGDGEPTTGDGDGEPTQEWCGLSDGPDEPWFEIVQHNTPLMTGGELELECGFQGSFMIEVRPRLGGFIPDADHVPFHVVLDVEGYNVGPNGHFAESDFNLFVACCDYDDEYSYGCYYEVSTFVLFPPDSIDDLSVLHGLPAELTVSMDFDAGLQLEKVVDVKMWAMDPEMEWQYCEYGYSTESLPVGGPPIPG